MTPRTLVLVPVAMALAIALVSCVGEPEAEPTETATEAPTPTATATEAPTDRVFTLPADCTGLLPESRQQALEGEGRILLGGPGGKYPDYYADPTPEEQAGGISCIWGDESTASSVVTVSAAPLSAATRSSVIDTLIAQGLNEAVLEDGVSYAQIGDETSAPAVLNVIRDDSWVSVIGALGGEARFNEAVILADEVADIVYGP